MPLPGAAFTKSKWLAFFAEISAKVTHHNLAVVVEGTELLRRLLLTRVGVGAVLEEGNLLTHLCDTLVASVTGSAVVVTSGEPRDAETVEALLQALGLVIGSAVSLHNERDPYYSLLVMSRVGDLLRALGNTLAASPRRHPATGHAAALALTILSTLPLAEAANAAPLDVPEHTNAARHVRTLEAKVRELPRALAAAGDSVQLALARHHDNPALVSGLRRLRATHRDVASDLAGADGGAAPEDCTTGGPLPAELPSIVDASFQLLQQATSHADVFDAIDRLWGCLVANAAGTVNSVTAGHLEAFAPFFAAEPRSSDDAAVFRMVLSWLGSCFLATDVVSPALRDFAVRQVTGALIPLLAASQSGQLQARAAEEQRRRMAANPVLAGRDASVASAVATTAAAPMGRPSTTLSILVFMQGVHSAVEVGPDAMARWAKLLLPRLAVCIDGCAGCTSVLIDAPSEIDGTLPDELYLQCALQSCRSDTTAVGCIAMKLLADILNAHPQLLAEDLLAETVALCQAQVVPCLDVIGNNPTMAVTRGAEGTVLQSAADQLSVVHYLPTCPRATRPASIGECAFIAADAMLSFCKLAQVRVAPIQQLIRTAHALHRATRHSVLPQLRTAAHRILLRTCDSFGDVIAVNGEMPAFTTNVAQALLTARPGSALAQRHSQWDCAGAAMWLAHVVALSNADPKASAVDLVHAALPLELLGVAANTPVSYGAAALLQLLSALADQQAARLRTHGSTSGAASVLAPQGKASMTHWLKLLAMHQAASAQLAASFTPGGAEPVRTVADDAMHRALSAVEEVKAQLWYGANMFRALCFLVETDLYEYLPQDTVCQSVSAVLNLPQGTEVLSQLAETYGVRVHDAEGLRQALSSAVAWGAELLKRYFCDRHTLVYHAVSADLLHGAAKALAARSELSDRSRLSVADALNSLLRLHAHPKLRESFGGVSAELFLSARALPPAAATHALRARLTNFFQGANHAASQCGWTSNVVAALKAAVASLLVNQGQLPPEEQGELAAALGFLSSTLSYRNAYPLLKSDAASLAASMAHLLKAGATRLLCLNAIRHLVLAEEGRALVLVDTAVAVEGKATAEHRSIFSRVVQLTFFGRVTPEEANCGTDVVSVACARGGDAFALPLLRMKVLDSIASMLIEFDRHRMTPPQSVYRLLASVTTCADIQLIVARHAELLTLIVEAAQDRACANSTLALMTVRNLAFHANAKHHLCLDTRVTGLLKAEFWQLPSAATPSAAGKKGGKQVAAARAADSDGQTLTDQLRRQELAGTALWSLAHHNQRCKSYLRNAMQAAPTVSLEDAERRHKLVGHVSALPGFADRLDEVLESLRAVGLTG